MKERPTRAQCEQAIAEGRARGETGEGEWNPYSGGPVALLARLWMRAYQEASDARRGYRIDLAESVARIRAAGGGVDGDDGDAEPDGL